MARLFAYALVFSGVAGLVVACADALDKSGVSTDEALSPMAADAGDAGSGPAKQSVVISQIYGGGGQANATLNHDFVELFNRTQKPVVLDGMSVQLSSSATGNFNHAIPLTGTLPAGSYWLIQLGTADDTVGTAIDGADQSDDTTIGSATDGKAAIAFSTTALNCGATANLCATTKFMDLVGYGAASQIEGLVSAPALDVSHADQRKLGGCTDSDGNSFDFTSVTPPAPRNSGTPIAVCTVPVKDAGTLPDGAPAPPVNDPPLGPESAYDAGYHPEAGTGPQSSGASSDCTVTAVGVDGSALGGLFASLGLVAAVIARRRRRAICQDVSR